MYTGKVINKVPGSVPGESKKEKQGYIGDLSLKTTFQLNELLERQVKLLTNKAFINRLADKGEKITKLKDTIEEELKKRSVSENLSRRLSSLTMNDKQELDALEWSGQTGLGLTVREEDISDDDENLFKILATHSGTGFHKKKHKIMKPEKPLIKPSDLVVDDSKEKGAPLEEYARSLSEKMDSMKVSQLKAKFLPFKTLKEVSSDKIELKNGSELEKRVVRHWEVTAATPPPMVHGDTKLVSLKESLRLQFEQEKKLKEMQMKHALERLTTWQGSSPGRLPQTTNTYREPLSASSSEDEHSEHEVHDEEDPDTGGVVIFNLVDDIDM